MAESSTTTPETLSVVTQLTDSISKFLNTFEIMTKVFVEKLQNSEIRAIEDSNKKPKSHLFQVPLPRNPAFLGRSESLSQLFGMWRPGQRCRIAICGLGGIGKTELALEFVYRLHQISPPTPIFWFSTTEFRQETAKDPTLSLDIWLEEDHSADCVLVVDPGYQSTILCQLILDYGTLKERLKAFKGTVILLCRNIQDAHQLVGPRNILELEDFDVESSTILLRNNLGPHAVPVTEVDMHDVVRLMTSLPRAIKQVLALINNTGMTIPQFLDMYSQSDALKLRLLGKLKPVSDPDQVTSIMGLGVIDIRQFRKSYIEASRMLYQIYFLGGTLVPKCIFSAIDTLSTIINTRILKGHFLVIEDSETGCFTIHPLVYLVLRNIADNENAKSEECESDIGQEQKWYDEVVVAFSKHYPDADNDDRTWWKDCFSQLLDGHDISSEAVRISIAAIHRKESRYLKKKGMFAQALKLADLAKSALPEPIPHEHLDFIHDQVSLLDILARYRDLQAALQSYPAEHQSGLLWRKRMGARLEDAECANKYSSAIEIFAQVHTARESSGSPLADVFSAVDDYAWALMLKGRYADAEIECRKALVGRIAELGTMHIDTLSSFHNIAEILRRGGKFDEALRYVQEAIRGRETALSSDHADTAHSRAVKSRILLAKAISLADFDEAETLQVNATHKLAASLGELHPIVMNLKSDRALIMLARGKYEAAEGIALSALKDKAQGPWLEPATHPDTLTSKHLLAEIIRLKEGCKSADSLSERSLTERTGVLTNGTLTGSDFHPDQLASLHHRAIVLSGLNQHLPALQKIDLALTGRREILGPDHPDVFLSMTWKAEIMRSQLPSYQSQRAQTLDAIDALHRTAYEGLSFIFGPEHHNTLQCLTNMAFAKNERGAPAHSAAEEMYRQVHRSYMRNLGEGHIETLKSKSRLAEATRVSDKGNHLEAKKMWREACAGFAKAYGVEAYVTVNAYKGYEKFLKTYLDA